MDLQDIYEFESRCFDVAHIKEVGPENHLKCLIAEVGELANVFRLRELTPPSSPLVKSGQCFQLCLEEELADILIYLVVISIAADIDLSEATKSKMLVVEERLKSGSIRYGEYAKKQKEGGSND